VPVSKIPEGLQDVKTTEDIFASREVDPSSSAANVDSVLSDLESIDGVKSSELFGGSGRRGSSKSKKGKDAEAGMEEEDDHDEDHDNEHELDSMSGAEGDEVERAKAAKFWSKGHSRLVGSKFVLLSDVLPPVPSKGDFDLEKIRDSLYFFS
jgi:hypothetical protein